MVYQAFMWRALQQEAAEEACSAASQTPQCLEVQLFRSWQQAAPSTTPSLVAGFAPGRAELLDGFEKQKQAILEGHVKSERELLSQLRSKINASNAHSDV